MQIDRVKYTAHYDEFGVLKDQWIGLEGQIDDTENPENKFDEIKAITERWYRKQNSQLQPDNSIPPGPPPIIQIKPEDRIIGVTVENIMSCEDVATVDSYRLLIKDNEALINAYNIRRSELVVRNRKAIIDNVKSYESLDDNK